MNQIADSIFANLLPIAQSKFFLGMLGIKVIVQNYLDMRQRRHINLNRQQVPKEFSNSLSLEDHDTSASYSLEQMNLNKIMRSLNLILLLLWTLGGGIEFCSNWAGTIVGNHSSVIHGLALFGIYGLISYLMMLPASIYSTFVLEHRYGLNNTTLKIFIADSLKQILLSIILGSFILSIILWIMNNLTQWWIYAFLAMSAFQILMLLIYPSFIAPLFNKFRPMDDGPMKTEAEDLLNEVQFSAKELLVMDASKRSNHGNAYFTGFGKSRRIVFYDTLLKQLTDKEMRAILAHEIGHFKLRHIYKRIILSFLMSFLGLFILWSLTQLPAFFTMHGVRSMGNAQALLLFSLVGGTYTFLLTPLSSILSRKHEYEADKFASQHALAEDLVTSLLKLYRNNMAFLTSDSAYATFYFSHPSAPERVAHLRSLPSK